MSSRLYERDPVKEDENLRRHGYDFDDGYRVMIQDSLGLKPLVVLRMSLQC